MSRAARPSRTASSLPCGRKRASISDAPMSGEDRVLLLVLTAAALSAGLSTSPASVISEEPRRRESGSGATPYRNRSGSREILFSSREPTTHREREFLSMAANGQLLGMGMDPRKSGPTKEDAGAEDIAGTGVGQGDSMPGDGDLEDNESGEDAEVYGPTAIFPEGQKMS